MKPSAPALRDGLAERAVTVAELLGRPVTFEQATDALITGFEEALGIRLELSSLTAEELATADRLCREVYATHGWNTMF